jgi:glycosyltransferase involved in cell wall biosynthesis
MKLLVVSNLYPPVTVGGAEIVAHRQALALQRRGYDVAVYAGGFPEPDFSDGSLSLEDVDGLPVYRFSLGSLSAGENFQWSVSRQRFKSVLSIHRPDIVHFHNVMGLGADLIPMAKSFGAKVAVTLHDHWGFCFKNTMLRNDLRVCTDISRCSVCLPTIAERGDRHSPIRLRRDFTAHCLDQADYLISPSRYLAAAYEGSNLFSRKVQPISNGIDLARTPTTTKPREGAIRFASFGYLGEHKGIKVLLDAAALLAQDEDLAGRWSLAIAGHGHLEESLTAMIEAGRFHGAVSYLGKLPHARAIEVMGDAHAMILASIWPENEPVTLIEAIASGTAQIASRIGGNVDLVEDGKSGFLFTPGDAGDLARCMRALITDPAKAAIFGARNVARRNAYSDAASVSAIEDVYRTAPVPASDDRLLVLCAGSAPTGALNLMMHEFPLLEDDRCRIRFVRAEWADAAIWARARLLWFWSDGGEDDVALLARAMRAAIPVLAPAGSAAHATSGGIAPIAAYDTLLQAAGHIAALQDEDDALARLAKPAPSMARMLTGVVKRRSFNLDAVTQY